MSISILSDYSYWCDKLTLEGFKSGLYVQDSNKEIFITAITVNDLKRLVSLNTGLCYPFDPDNDCLHIIEKESQIKIKV